MLRVLAVDEHQESADTWAVLCSQKGHLAMAVHDCTAAVDAALQLIPDGVILEVDRPESEL